MKAFLALVFILLLHARCNEENVEIIVPHVPGYVNFSIGFISEIYSVFNVTGGEICLENIPLIAMDIMRIINMIQNKTITFTKIVELVRDLVPALVDEFKNCLALYKIVPAITNYVNLVIKHIDLYFSGLIKNAMMEIVSITSDIEKIIYLFNKKQYEEVGSYLAYVICKIFVVKF